MGGFSCRSSPWVISFSLDPITSDDRYHRTENASTGSLNSQVHFRVLYSSLTPSLPCSIFLFFCYRGDRVHLVVCMVHGLQIGVMACISVLLSFGLLLGPSLFGQIPSDLPSIDRFQRKADQARQSDHRASDVERQIVIARDVVKRACKRIIGKEQ